MSVITAVEPGSLSLALPPGFHVLAAHDPAAVDAFDETDLDEAGRAWLAQVRATSAASDALLCAVHAETWQGEIAHASLVVTARSFDDDPDLALAALRRYALENTSTSGQVVALSLPLGQAVGSADLVFLGEERVPTGLVEVQVVEASTCTVIQLTLCTPRPPLLSAYAAMTADIAAQLSLDAGVA